LLAAVTFPSSAQDRVVSTSLGGQTITADELRAAGITRLSNVFVLFDGVRFTTVDGFTTTPSFNGLAALQDRVWHVEVDGQPVDDGVLDVQSLNTLGVPITAIDRIVVRDVPHVRRSRFEHGGVVEIWTKAGREKGFVRSAVSVGNETGDPGPYRYADPALRLQNVDKEGPDVAIEGGFARSGIALHGGVSMNQIIPSDPAVFSRNLDVFDISKTPVMRVVAPFLALKSALPRGDVAVRLSAATFDDMLFTRDIGREIPAEYRRAGVTTVANMSDFGIDWKVNAGMSQRIVRNFSTATRIPFHWDEQTAAASLAGAGPVLDGVFTAGLAVDYIGARSELGILNRLAVSTRRIHAGYARQVGPATASITAFGAFADDARSGGAALEAEVPLWGNQRLGATASVAQTLPLESNPQAYWAYRGLSLSSDSQTEYPGEESESQLASVDVQWMWVPTESQLLQVSAIGRRFAGLRLSNRSIVADGDGFAVTSLSYDKAWGATIGVRARGEVKSGRSRFALAYSYQTVLAGNEVFYDAFATISRRQLRLSAVHRIADRFSISNTIYHFSDSRWAEFESIENQTDYSSRVPGFVRWDVAFYKGLAADKLQLSFVFENILNDRVGYHPIGATFDRALRVQLAIVLD
jgi:hypothetical protein